jgi:hypothetical protein
MRPGSPTCWRGVDLVERGAESVAFDFEVVAGLQVQLETFRGAEVTGQAQRGVGVIRWLPCTISLIGRGGTPDRDGELVLRDAEGG